MQQTAVHLEHRCSDLSIDGDREHDANTRLFGDKMEEGRGCMLRHSARGSKFATGEYMA